MRSRASTILRTVSVCAARSGTADASVFPNPKKSKSPIYAIMPFMTSRALVLLAAACVGGAAAEWSPALHLQFRSVANVTPSPDGKLVVWAETWAIMETEKSETLTQLFLARTDGSQRVQLTRGDKSATSAQFSPDSRYVFFMSDRDGKKNLYRIPVGGGEAEKLTDWKGTLETFRVSPDG